MIRYATIAQMGMIAFGTGSVAIRCMRSFCASITTQIRTIKATSNTRRIKTHLASPSLRSLAERYAIAPRIITTPANSVPPLRKLISGSSA